MSLACPLVVFSDLDGTLLDSQRPPSVGAAAKALERLALERIPLVLCSSKTRAEIECIQQDLGIRYPFVCENGGGVFVPIGYFAFDVPGAHEVAGYHAVEFGRPYAEVVDVLRRAAARTRVAVVGFNDMTVEEVAAECELPLLQARLAKLREYDEPFRILDPRPAARSRLLEALHAAHMVCTSGGRYDHVGAAVDKGVGVDLLRFLYRRAIGPILAIGIGNAPNDVSLLRQVDVPVIIHNGDADAAARLHAKVPTARLTRASGAEGWAEALVEILDDRCAGSGARDAELHRGID